MTERQERYNVVDTLTGEVVDNVKGLYPEPLNEDGYRFPSHKAGSLLFADVEFPAEMSVADIGRMTILSKVMIAASNMLGYRQSGTIKAYTEDEIIRLAKLRDRQGRAFMANMLRLHLMHRIETPSEVQ